MKRLYSGTVGMMSMFLFVLCCRTTTKTANQQPATLMETQKAARFACLPGNVQLTHVVSYGKREVTVEETLDAMQAKCENGKLVDQNKKEIRFFRIACFGNPPYNYDEIRQREQEEIARLRENFNVIVIECNPMIQ